MVNCLLFDAMVKTEKMNVGQAACAGRQQSFGGFPLSCPSQFFESSVNAFQDAVRCEWQVVGSANLATSSETSND
jgi:hypothetical protein